MYIVWLDALAGHDSLDSTTVTDSYRPVDLENVDCLAELSRVTIGVPRVRRLHIVFNDLP